MAQSAAAVSTASTAHPSPEDLPEDLHQEWQTPDDLWQGLHAEFNFDLDVAANAINAKVPHFYDRAANGLTQPWDGKRVWCNAPYRRLQPWVDKAAQETGSVLAVLLLPARTEQQWFRTVLHRATEIAFFDARIQFVPPRNLPSSSNREGGILAVFGPTKYGLRETIRCARTGKVLHTWERR